jgi:hypothetical protein
MESLRFDWLRRALRTFVQAFVGSLILTLVPWLQTMQEAVGSGDDVVIDPNFLQATVLSAIIAGMIALVSGVQNLLEDKVPAVPAIGKAPASGGQNPVPDGST